MDEVTVHVEAEINPTESEDKVKTAVTNVLGNASITIKPAHKGSILNAEAKGQDSLVKLRNLLRNDGFVMLPGKRCFTALEETLLVFA